MRLRRLTGAVAVTAVLAGCSSQGIYAVPLPGGEATGDDVYRVSIQFRDVLDLVPQSAVKVNDVTVGSVEKIELHGYLARVRVRLKSEVKLPDNAEAEIRQTSLLGEKFVSLAAPPGQSGRGRLADGDVIPVSRSGRSAEVEEVLAAFSMLLNGGGVEQLRTINLELSEALAGREDKLRNTLDQLEKFIGGLDAQKADIVRALDGLDRLAATLEAQKQTIATALEQIGPGLKVLADQRTQLVAMLRALDRLGAVGTRVIRESRADTVADLRALQPILEKLVAAGTYLPRALEIVFHYPFPKTAVNGIRGDFTNLYATLDLDLQNTLSNLIDEPPPPDQAEPQPGSSARDGRSDLIPGLPQVPGGAPPSPGLLDLLVGGALG